MTDVVLMIIVWAVLYMAAFVILPAWRRRHDAGIGLFAKNHDNKKLIVTKALEQLNCRPQWSKDEGNDMARFDFQSGHFRIYLLPDSPYVRLSYLFFYNADTAHIEPVRSMVNQCNLNTETLKMVYTLNAEAHKTDLHMMAELLMNEQTAKSILSRAMTDMFRWQNTFTAHMTQTIGEHNRLMGMDIEKNNAEWQHETALLHELEMAHRDAETLRPQTAEHPIVLGELLKNTLDLTDIIPLQLRVIAGDHVARLDDTNAILQFKPAETLIADNRFLHDETLLLLNFFDARRPEKERSVNISVRAEGQTDHTLYYRLTPTLVPIGPRADVGHDTADSRGKTVSVLAAYDLTDPKQRLDEFRYMWKEALEKVKKGETDLTDEQRLICRCTRPVPADNLYRGKLLFNRKRFYEALPHFESAYSFLKSQIDAGHTDGIETFYDACYYTGFCYSELQQYERAFYYLSMTLSQPRITYTEAYVNCLVNNNDVRTLHVIDELLRELGIALKDDGEQADPVKASFGKFLFRRKAYVLICRQQLDEAEQILQRMLNDPDSSDFAINELAHIKKKKSKQ